MRKSAFFKNLYVSLHTADPISVNICGELFEVNYQGYSRVRVNSADLEVSLDEVNFKSPVFFPVNTCGKARITHFGISDDKDHLLYSGVVNPPIEITEGIIPSVSPKQTKVKEKQKLQPQDIWRNIYEDD